ncbi:MAG: polyprenyl diphosphate synthase [Pseudomonadota bacterium]
MQSHLEARLHLGIIMDGNGRWAVAQGRPRIEGHRAGLRAARALVERLDQSPVHTLTLYAFSADNWKRPAGEVSGLMDLFERFLRNDLSALARQGVRLTVIGRRDRLPAGLVAAIAAAERATAGAQRKHLRIAADYSSRWAIVQAAHKSRPCDDLHAFGAALAPDTDRPSIDLLIRTGGEQRLSDFMLWEAAYAEIFFTAIPWPAFGPDDLAAALRWYAGRDRRFGRIHDAKNNDNTPVCAER